MAAKRAKRQKREKLIGETPAEKRAARKAAAQQCAAERRRLVTWVPAERKRVAGELVSMEAELAQSISTLRAQHRERVKDVRAELAQRIKTARENARQGVCVDMTAGPIVRRFGPRLPPELSSARRGPAKRPPPPGSRAADPVAYDRRSRELVSEALEAQRRAAAHERDMAAQARRANDPRFEPDDRQRGPAQLPTRNNAPWPALPFPVGTFVKGKGPNDYGRIVGPGEFASRVIVQRPGIMRTQFYVQAQDLTPIAEASISTRAKPAFVGPDPRVTPSVAQLRKLAGEYDHQARESDDGAAQIEYGQAAARTKAKANYLERRSPENRFIERNTKPKKRKRTAKSARKRSAVGAGFAERMAAARAAKKKKRGTKSRVPGAGTRQQYAGAPDEPQWAGLEALSPTYADAQPRKARSAAAPKSPKQPSAAARVKQLKREQAKRLRAERGQYRYRQVGNKHVGLPSAHHEEASSNARHYAGQYALTMAVEKQGPKGVWTEIERYAPKSKSSIGQGASGARAVAASGQTNRDKTDPKLAKSEREGARERARDAALAKR